jgi:hypothetical protein
MKLEWSPLIRVKERVELKDANKRGVYIWGFRIENEFIPYYVGIAIDIEKRIKEHLSFIISGKYSIYDKNDLKEFYKHEIKFIPNWPNNFLDFLSRRRELLEDIDFMIDNFEFSFAEVKEKEYPQVKLKEVEKYFIKLFEISCLANSRGGESEIENIEYVGDEEMVKIFEKRKK